MPAPDEDLGLRVSALEHQMIQLRERVQQNEGSVAGASFLASRADHDVSEFGIALRAHISSLNALRETQIEHGHRLDGIDGRLDGIDGRLDGIDGRLDRMDGRLDRMDGRLDGIDGRLDRMDGRLEELTGAMRVVQTGIVTLLARSTGSAN
jgi:hypothetical protein